MMEWPSWGYTTPVPARPGGLCAAPRCRRKASHRVTYFYYFLDDGGKQNKRERAMFFCAHHMPRWGAEYPYPQGAGHG